MITQIVPEPPASLGGVRAYAQRLHELDPDLFGPPVQGFKPKLVDQVQLDPRTGAALLLHYSNYGYDRSGCPGWLADAVELLNNQGVRCVIFFHEVFASGPPWTRAFWNSAIQRSIAGRIAREASTAITSLPLYVSRLSRLAPNLHVDLLPLLSTIGEPMGHLPLAEREPVLVLFGSRGLRLRAYRRVGDDILATCRKLGLEIILDMGQVDDEVRSAARRLGFPVEHRGILENAEVSRALQKSRAGFLAYPSTFLGKSTVYAAFAAHGILPVCSWPASADGSSASPPHALVHEHGFNHPQAIADAANAWYKSHNAQQQLAIYRRILNPSCAS